MVLELIKKVENETRDKKDVSSEEFYEELEYYEDFTEV